MNNDIMFFMDDSYLEAKDFNREHLQITKDILLKNKFNKQFELYSHIASFEFISEKYTITLYPLNIDSSSLFKEWVLEVLNDKSIVIGQTTVTTIYHFNSYIKSLNINFKLTA